MTLRVYTDVTGVRPKTRMASLLGEWAPMGTSGESGIEAGGAEAVAVLAGNRS